MQHPGLGPRRLDVLRPPVGDEVLQRHRHEHRRGRDGHGSIDGAEAPDGAGVDLAAGHADHLGVQVQARPDGNWAAEVSLKPSRHRRRPQQPDQRAQSLIEGSGQQSAVGQPRSALVMLTDSQFRGQGDAFPGANPQVQPGRMVLTAPEAKPVVRGDLLPRSGGIGVALRNPHIGGRIGAATTHSADPTDDSPARADRLRLVESELTHSERLWAPWPWWAGGLALIATLAWAYGYATRGWVGWLVFGIGGALYLWWLWRAAAPVEVGPDGLRAAGAHLTPEYLGAVLPLDRDESARLRGVEADPRAFLILRGWIPTAVRVDVADPDDPVPYWYVSTRQPEQLAQCLIRLRPDRDHTAAPD